MRAFERLLVYGIALACVVMSFFKFLEDTEIAFLHGMLYVILAAVLYMTGQVIEINERQKKTTRSSW